MERQGVTIHSLRSSAAEGQTFCLFYCPINFSVCRWTRNVRAVLFHRPRQTEGLIKLETTPWSRRYLSLWELVQSFLKFV